MDVGKDQSHLTLNQTPEAHIEKSHAPDIIGSWSLRNREQLKKRKAEAQGRQTSQWQPGEQKKRKYQRTGKGNRRGRKRQGNVEQKAASWSQTENERVQEVLVPAEEETEYSGNPATQALPLRASPTKAVPIEHCSEVPQESLQCQEITIQNHSQTHQRRDKAEALSPTTCQEIGVLQYSPKMCQDMAEPEARSPKMCQETAVAQTYSPKAHEDMAEHEGLSPKMCRETPVPQYHSSKIPQDMTGPEALAPDMCQETTVSPNHSSKVPQDMAGPEALSLKMCQEPTVLQEHTLKICQDVARPDVLSSKTHQEMTVPEALPCITSGDAAGPEGCSPKTLPQSDVSPMSVTPGKNTSHPDLGTAVTEGCFSEAGECIVSEDISTKTHQEAVEPEFLSHKTYKEFTVPIVSPHKTIQGSPGPEEYSPGSRHEMSGPEDLSIKTCKNRDGPKHSLPEGAQEVGGAQGQDPDAQDSEDEDAGAFSQDMEEGNKADQDPETPAGPQGPQKICPENDVHSSALF